VTVNRFEMVQYSRSDLNQDSFPLKKVLRRSHKSDTSTIRVVALSQDGTYLTAGFDSGLIEVSNHDSALRVSSYASDCKVHTTTGSMNPVRLFTAGAQVNCIVWHPMVLDCFMAGSTNGHIHTITLSPSRNPVRSFYIF
jgi:WD40 repeat protein